MNVEDEYFSAIEHRDTEILMRDKQIAEQKAQLSASIRLMLEQNIPSPLIAKALGIDEEEVNAYK